MHNPDCTDTKVVALLPDTLESEKLVKVLNKGTKGEIYTTRLTSTKRWIACTTGGL